MVDGVFRHLDTFWAIDLSYTNAKRDLPASPLLGAANCIVLYEWARFLMRFRSFAARTRDDRDAEEQKCKNRSCAQRITQYASAPVAAVQKSLQGIVSERNSSAYVEALQKQFVPKLRQYASR